VSFRVPTEADIQRDCVASLERWGAVVIRTNSGAVKVADRLVRFNRKPGCSDTLVCLPGGRFAAVEFKRPGKRATEKQSAFLAEVVAAGGLGLVATSLSELRAQLRGEGFDVSRLV
jgi:hypothetical protein